MKRTLPRRTGVKTLYTLSASIGALCAGSLGVVHAQESSEEEARTLNTVTITATKREQTLQDVPVAVSVVDDTVIEQAQIQDISDLQSVVPSLRVTTLQSSAQTNFVIRGFGNGANNAGIEPSVGVFIDGVYRSRSAAQIADLPNVQRVEVLRGPQSTLFGKNASAGVISVVTEEPQFEFGGSVEGGISNYNGYNLKGDITGPITENLAFSLSAGTNQRDGYVEKLTEGDDLNDRNRSNIRGQLLYTPNETSKFRLIADYSNIDELCCAVTNTTNGPTAGIIELLGGELNDSDNPFSYTSVINGDPVNDVEDMGISLHADFEFDGFNLASITAYRENDRLDDSDADYTSLDVLYAFNDTQIETFTQEFRLISNNPDSRVDWLAGAYIFIESIDQNGGIRSGADARDYVDFLGGGAGTLSFLEATFGVPDGTFYSEDTFTDELGTQDNDTYSLFGQVDYHLTDRLTLTGGLNYTIDNKETSYTAVINYPFSGIDLNGTGLEAFQALQFAPQFVDYPNSVEDGKSDDEKLTWTARAAFDATDNINVYASAGTGFKSTSWNLSRDSRPFPEDQAALEAAGLDQNNQTYGTRFAEPEESTVYEMGLKASFPTLAVNVAIFDQTIENFQSNIFTGTGFVLGNAEEQSTQGVELDATWTPIDPLTLTFAGTFMDPVYDSYANSSVGDLSGEQPSGIHETSISTSATYTKDFANGMTGYIRADYLYESEVQVVDAAEGDPLADVMREVNTVNGAIGLILPNGLEARLWGRNILDDEYFLSAFPGVIQDGTVNAYTNAPATYGISLKKTF